MYYWRFAIFGAIYLGLFLFAIIIRKIQGTQLNRRYLAEKKITELQVKIIRNQLDPHFAMNAINSAVAAIQQNNTGKAEPHLYSFSRLYRHLLLTADRITCLLAEELEFTENYVNMEQNRFPDLFSFEKSIDSRVDTNIEIPKMAIQSHVENAIKHGLRRRSSGGILRLNVSVDGSVLNILISDNGIGRAEAAKLGSDSTGKGNHVMEEYFALFQKITGQKVYSDTEDLFDETGRPAGTCVKIFITLPKKDQKDEQKKI
jgi:LytS/YehU family sensor histidine kinase